MSSEWRLKKWFPNLNEDIHLKLEKFNGEIVKFNPALNLLSANAINILDAEHFFDSISGLNLVLDNIKPKTVYDFGSGNGFPGIVGAICFPDIKWNLVESDIRKCEFLKFCASTVSVANLEVLNKRVEALADGEVNIAVARGFAPLDQAMLITSKVFSSSGSFFHFKGPSWAKELSKVPPQIFSKWKFVEKGYYVLPSDNSSRFIIETKKV